MNDQREVTTGLTGPPANSIGIDGLKNSILSDLVLRYSPEYYVFLANSSNVVFNKFDISGYSSSANLAKNTDGWDTYRSSDITIMDSVINNGDGKQMAASRLPPPPNLGHHRQLSQPGRDAQIRTIHLSTYLTEH